MRQRCSDLSCLGLLSGCLGVSFSCKIIMISSISSQSNFSNTALFLQVLAAYADAGVSATAVGTVSSDADVSIAVGSQQQISGACRYRIAEWVT